MTSTATHDHADSSHAAASDHDHHSAPQRTNFEVRVLRQDAPGETSYWQRHRIAYERDMNVIECVAANRRAGRNDRGGARCARGLGLQLPRRSLRRLHDGDQWQCRSASGVFGRWSIGCWKTTPPEIEFRPMSKFPVLRDLRSIAAGYSAR